MSIRLPTTYRIGASQFVTLAEHRGETKPSLRAKHALHGNMNRARDLDFTATDAKWCDTHFYLKGHKNDEMFLNFI